MNRTERLTRDMLLFGLISAWVLAGVVFRGEQRRWGVWPRRRRFTARYVGGQVGMLAVSLGPRYAEQVLRRIQAGLRPRNEGADSRTPARPAPELATAVSEQRPPTLRGGAWRDAGPGPTRPSYEVD